MEQDNEILRNYIERVTKLQEERRTALALSDLQTIARELGMSEDDVAAAEQAARAHLDRGMGHSRYGLWDDAINELRSAVALDPNGIEGLDALSAAYRERWRLGRDAADRQAAIACARRALEIDPKHEPAFAMLHDLGNPAREESKPTTKRSWTVIVPIWIALFVVALGIALWSRRGNSPPEPPPIITSTGVQLPVELNSNARYPGLQLKNADARFNRATNEFTLTGDLVSPSSFAEDIVLRIELLNQSGIMRAAQIISTREMKINVAMRGTPDIDKVRIWVQGQGE